MESNLLGKMVVVTHPTEEHQFIHGKECSVVGMDLSNQKYIVKTPIFTQTGQQITARLDLEEFEIKK